MQLYFWLYLIISSVIICLLVHLYVVYTYLNYFPTPRFVPILGHVFDYVDFYKAPITLTNNLVKLGGTIRQLIGPRKPTLVTANKDFLQFLVSNSKYVCKSKYYRFLKPWLGEGLITSEGQKWQSRRKALTSSLTQTSVLKSFIDIFAKQSDILVSIFDRLDNQEIDLQPIMKKFTLDVFCETALGISLDSQLDPTDLDYARNIGTICEIVQHRTMSWLKSYDWFFRFSKDYVKEQEALAGIERMLQKIIRKKQEENLKTGMERPKKDMLDLLMELEIDGKKLSDSDLREEINTLTFAGYDTTSAALSFALYEIANHPEIQAKLLEEQKNLFKEHVDDPKVTYDVLNEMPYLEMVIKESLRIHPIIPYVGKRNTRDLHYDGKLIPSMTNIAVFIYGFHYNPNYFCEPEKFIPERFADKNKVDKSTYMPFGVKPRQCLGKNYAMLELKCTLSKIIRKFQVIQVANRPLKTLPTIVLQSSSGIWVTVKRRQGLNNNKI